MRLTLLALAVAALCAGAQAQGSQRSLGGGCTGYGGPGLAGPLAIGTTLRIESTGCLSPGASSFQVMFFGVPLPPGGAITLPLRAKLGGIELCDVVILPLVAIDLTLAQLPQRVPIPNNPALQGAKIGVQTFCFECGFPGCWQALTQGVEITIG